MSLDNLILPKNNLFKLTCRDVHNHPNYTFTWELTPEGAKILQEKEIRFPYMYVFAVEEIPPKKNENHQEGCGCRECAGYNKVVEEELFCLHEGAGQIQFLRQGTFRIYAMVVWDHCPCKYDTWKSTRKTIFDNPDLYQGAIINESEFKCKYALPHVEEDAVQISSTFWAATPNPKLWWWANLWWDEKPKNSCEYRKRIWFVLWAQLITVSLWVMVRGTLMALSYLGLLLVGFRPSSLSFRPMFHPFSSVFEQLCEFGNPLCNYVIKDSKGETRQGIGAILRLPLIWIAGPISLGFIVRGIYYQPREWLIATLIIASGLCCLIGLHYFANWIESRRKSITVYYEQVPVEKPKKARVPVKVRWLDAKGKLCLPFPEK